MERKEFNIQGTVRTTPAPTDMDISVDVSDMDFGSPAAGVASAIVQRVMTITGRSDKIKVSIGATDWIASDRVMAGSTTEVSVDNGPYIPVIVAGEVALGDLTEGEYILNFKMTPPADIDLNEYTQKIIVIGE